MMHRALTNIMDILSGRSGLTSMGPNQARVLYDFVAGCSALAAAVIFSVLFMNGEFQWWFILMPISLIGLNAVFGIYTRLRTSRGRLKATVLAIAVICVSGVAYVLATEHAVIVLWAMLVIGPLTMARILLGLPYSKHRNLATVIVKQRGPILVIGGAGYIGSHTVELFLNEGYPVRVLDSLIYGRGSLSGFEGHKNFELIEGDSTDIVKLTAAMKDASAVIQLGGLVGDPACAVDPDFTRHANIIATRMAKDVAQSMGVYRFVFSSSCSVYGVSDHEVREGDNLNPVSLYAQTKIDSETELLSNIRDDFFVTILRFATVYGHSRRPRFDLVTNLFTAQAMLDGLITVIGPDQWRPFVHVRDLARALLIVTKADARRVQSEIFNVGDKNQNMTILQLAQTVKQVVGKERDVDISIRENPEDRRNYMVSFDKIRSALAFEAATTIQDGITEMADNFKTGVYGHYSNEIYSNLKMTRKAFEDFLDPMHSASLYAPLSIGRTIPSENANHAQVVR